MMGTFNVTAAFFADPRFHKAGLRAIGVWVGCGSWRAEWVLDAQDIDFIPKPLVRMVGGRAPDVRALVESGLWIPDGAGFRMAFQGDLWTIGASSPVRPRISDRVRRFVYKRDNHRCVECGATENLSLDHIYPYSRGGSDSHENLRTLCRSCNSKKGARV